MSQGGAAGVVDREKQRAERRFAVATFFITTLVAIAIQEAISPVRAAVQKDGVSYRSFALFLVFLLTVTRFYIGNFRHLQKLAEKNHPGSVWILDLSFIMLMHILLIFMGTVATVEANRETPVGFVPVLVAICAVDVLWAVAQWGAGRIVPSMEREKYTWGWAVLSGLLILSVLGFGWVFCAGEYYGLAMQIFLPVVSLIAFYLDVKWFDD